MDCQAAQERILESFDGVVREERELDLHLSQCPQCADFVKAQKTLDVRLAAAISAPPLSPGFRAALRRRMRQERRDSLPDLVHLSSCGVATAICALLLPFSAATVVPVGLALTGITYLLQIVLRNSFEELEEASW